MKSRRLKLHRILCAVLSCPVSGDECRVYFQPPINVKMKYPAVVYSLNNIKSIYANDGVYLAGNRYSLVLIDKDPDSELVDKVTHLPACHFNRHYTRDNLYHNVFEIFF